MKLHTPDELASLLSVAVNEMAPGIEFALQSVEAPPDTMGWVTLTFSLGGVVARIERDRGEVDLYVKGPDAIWHNLTRLNEFIGAKRGGLPPVKSKGLFDPGYSEDGAIRDVIGAFCRILSDAAALIASADHYAEFVASLKRRVPPR